MDPIPDLVGSYCVCHNVTYEEISSLVKSLSAIDTKDKLTKYIYCGQTCKLCTPDICKIIEYHRK